MQFERSTQAKSWIFSATSLNACRKRAMTVGMESLSKRTVTVSDQVQKFASGFHRLYKNRPDSSIRRHSSSCLSGLSWSDQEIMVQFHANQIQFLVGPSAILLDLRTSEVVLSTAITFFRRFYLSNSIVAVSPRKIAAACAFFAAKVEEEKVEVSPTSWEVAQKDVAVLSGAQNFASIVQFIFINLSFLPRESSRLYVRWIFLRHL